MGTNKIAAEGQRISLQGRGLQKNYFVRATIFEVHGMGTEGQGKNSCATHSQGKIFAKTENSRKIDIFWQVGRGDPWKSPFVSLLWGLKFIFGRGTMF